MTLFAMTFPGQGSQSVGMLAELAAAYPVVGETFEQASDALGRDLWKLVCDGPAEELNRTELTQPALLAAAIAVWRVWRLEGGPGPERMAGHSLGEYSALVAAEALEFSDAVAVVAERGRLMQSAVSDGEGAMAAILGLDDEVVEAICREAAEGRVVEPANYNSPGQLVIAGNADAVERAIHKCKEAGAKRAMTLPVSVPSHCTLMSPAADALGELLAETPLRPPAVAVVHNVDCQPRSEPDAIRQALVEQLCSPVRWTGSVRSLIDGGVERLAECGPGKVLSGLGRRIDRNVEWVALEQPERLQATAAEWKEKRA